MLKITSRELTGGVKLAAGYVCVFGRNYFLAAPIKKGREREMTRKG